MFFNLGERVLRGVSIVRLYCYCFFCCVFLVHTVTSLDEKVLTYSSLFYSAPRSALLPLLLFFFLLFFFPKKSMTEVSNTIHTWRTCGGGWRGSAPGSSVQRFAVVFVV